MNFYAKIINLFRPAILAFVLFWASTTEGRDAIGSCTADQQYMIDYINQYRSYPVICDQVLSYIAYMHTKDQNDYYNSQPEGTTLYTSSCNKHSWKLTQPCCFPSDFSNSKCMWEAIDRIIPRGKDYGIGNIYEVSLLNMTQKKKDVTFFFPLDFTWSG